MNDALDWAIEYDGAAPPLPEKIDLSGGKLSRGAYFVWLDPVIAGRNLRPPGIYAGILRVAGPPPASEQAKSGNEQAKSEPAGSETEDKSSAGPEEESGPLGVSGDLYACSRGWVKGMRGSIRPGATLPVVSWTSESGGGLRGPNALKQLQLPRHSYRYYLRGKAPRVNKENRFELELDPYAWQAKEKSWKRSKPLFVELARPAGEGPNELLGVYNCYGTRVAGMGLLRIANDLRCATIRVHDTYRPGTFDASDKWNEDLWRHKLHPAGWYVDLVGAEPVRTPGKSSEDLNPKEGKWSRAMLREYYDELNDRLNGPAAGVIEGSAGEVEPWGYTFLVVRDMVRGDSANPRGMMFEAGTREAAAVAAEREPRYMKDIRFGGSWFMRVALHEFGHMQGLYHNSEPGLMRRHSHTVGEIKKRMAAPKSAASRQPAKPAGDEAGASQASDLTKDDLAHHPLDAFRLQHLPDMWVRPGGVPFGHRYRETGAGILDLVPADSHELTLKLKVFPERINIKQSVNDLTLELTLKNPKREPPEENKGVICPNQRHIQPRYRRLGLLLQTPAGDEIEVLPIGYPRSLGALANTVLLGGEEIVLRVDWTDREGEGDGRSREQSESRVLQSRTVLKGKQGRHPREQGKSRPALFDDIEFDQVGDYKLVAHLMWMVDDEDEEDAEGHDHVHYHVEADDTFSVEGRAGIGSEGQEGADNGTSGEGKEKA